MMIVERQEAAHDDDDGGSDAYEELRRVLKEIEDALHKVRILARRMRLNGGG